MLALVDAIFTKTIPSQCVYIYIYIYRSLLLQRSSTKSLQTLLSLLTVKISRDSHCKSGSPVTSRNEYTVCSM